MKNLTKILIPTLAFSFGIFSNAFAQKMYWTDIGTDKIQRADLDGSNVEDIVAGLTGVTGIALNITSSKLYWIDSGSAKIQRADLDGSNIEDLVTGLAGGSGITLDKINSKIYWTDDVFDKIQRADLDGSNVEDIVTNGLVSPNSIALDVTSGKMYWADSFSGKIQRANLDGTSTEDIITGLNFPNSITLDLTNSKMYWNEAGKIHRADLGGSNIEELTINSNNPEGIALDVTNSKIYWTDNGTDKIQRANLDGSSIEDLVTGLSSPSSIALGISDAPLSVELDSFTARQIGRTIGLSWSTASETENAGFNVYRKIGNNDFVQISSYENNSELVGALNTSTSSFYTFVDNSEFKNNELYTYYVSDVETNGTETKHTELAQSVVYEIKSQVVDRFQLKQNFPNPFNPSTTISYNLGENVDVSLKIYNEKGEFVKELVNENQNKGSHSVDWNGTDSFGKEVSSGTYFYKIETESFTRSQKMILLK